MKTIHTQFGEYAKPVYTLTISMEGADSIYFESDIASDIVELDSMIRKLNVRNPARIKQLMRMIRDKSK